MQFAGNRIAFQRCAGTQTLRTREFLRFWWRRLLRQRVRIRKICVENDYSGKHGENSESKASQHALSMPDALFEIEITHRLLCRLVFGLFEGFLEFAI